MPADTPNVPAEGPGYDSTTVADIYVRKRRITIQLVRNAPEDVFRGGSYYVWIVTWDRRRLATGNVVPLDPTGNCDCGRQNCCFRRREHEGPAE